MKVYSGIILLFFAGISQKNFSRSGDYIKYTGHPNVNWISLLCDAAEEGNFNAVRHYLRNGVDANGVSCGFTPLMHVCNRCYFDDDKEADLKIVQELLQAGADPNLPCESRANNTALHMAVTHYKSKIVAALLESKANVHRKNFYGWSPLYVAYNESWRCDIQHRMAEVADKDQVIMLLKQKGAIKDWHNDIDRGQET